MNNKQSLRFIDLKHLFGFLVAVFIVILSIYFQHQLVNLKSLGLLGVFLASFLGNATFLVPFSNTFRYEPFFFGLITSLGGAMGQMVGFELGLAGEKLFIKKHHIVFLILRDIFRDFGKFIVFFLALLPDQFFGVVSLLAGISGFPPLKFFVLVLAGRLVRNLIILSLGFTF